MGMSKSVTIGFKYYMDILMGVSRGELDEITEIQVSELTAWKGSITGNTTIQINAPDLFGGEKKEGGIQGTLQVFMGAKTQVFPNSIKSMIGGIVPSFRGRCTLYFSGLVCAMSPYPKAWRMRVRRWSKGWNGAVWNPSQALINMTADDGSAVKAMNPAHIIYQCMTDPSWGRGFDSSRLDSASFLAAAQQLYNEGFGLCLLWSRQDTITQFIQTVLDHIGAVHYLHPRTGKFVLKLIRDDYDHAAGTTYSYANGVVSVEDLTLAAPDSAINSVVVKYTDPVTGNQLTCVPVENLGGITMAAAVNQQTTNYFGLPNNAFATRLAERDLMANMGFLRRLTVHMDRRGWDKMPGDIIALALPNHGIERMLFRVGKVTHSNLVEGGIALTVVQDVFGLPSTSTVKRQAPGWVAPDQTARAVTYRKARELSYRDLYRAMDAANFALLDSTDSYVGLLCARPAGLGLNFDLYSNYAGSGYQLRATAGFCPNATVISAIAMGASDIVVNLANVTDLDQVTTASAAVIDNEEFVVKAIDLSGLTVTLGRGCQDTIPSAHAAGARIWFYDDADAEDPTQYPTGAVVQMKALTRTSSQLLDIASASPDSITTISRLAKPLPPGNVKVNGMSLDNLMPFERPGVITWAHRNRVVQQDQLYPHTQGSFALPAGVTYTVRILKPDGTVLRTVTGLTTATWTYDASMILADGIDDSTGGSFRLQLWAVESGVQSWQIYDLNLVVLKPGLGQSLGYYLGGATA